MEPTRDGVFSLHKVEVAKVMEIPDFFEFFLLLSIFCDKEKNTNLNFNEDPFAVHPMQYPELNRQNNTTAD
jgi:hypothetical protein